MKKLFNILKKAYQAVICLFLVNEKTGQSVRLIS